LPGGALALEALDQHGVIGDGRRVVDEPAEELIVGGGADTELAPDGLLLGPGVPPPVALEGQDAPLPLAQGTWGAGTLAGARRPGGAGGLLPCVVLHVLSPQFSGGRDRAASQDRRYRTPKI
jgi:hypothetical protein